MKKSKQINYSVITRCSNTNNHAKMKKIIPYEQLKDLEEGDALEIIYSFDGTLRIQKLYDKKKLERSFLQRSCSSKFIAASKATSKYLDRVTPHRRHLLKCYHEQLHNYVMSYLMRKCMIQDPKTGNWMVDENKVPLEIDC